MKISKKISTIILNFLILGLVLCMATSCGKEEPDISITLNSTNTPKVTTASANTTSQTTTAETATSIAEPVTTTVAQTSTVESTIVQETTTLETTIPQTTVLETTIPQTTVLETTIPQTTVLETTIPQTTVLETTVPETTAVPAPTIADPTTVAPPTVSSTSGTSYGSYVAYNCNTTFYNDLNMDGVNEEIQFICPPGDNNYYIPYFNGISDVYVKVNNVTYSLNNFSIEGIVSQIYVIDINSSDGIKELAFCTYGPSADYETFFLYYTNNSFVEMGTIPGMFSNPSNSSNFLSLNGQGIITTSFYRLNIFQTWFSTQDYTLGAGHTIIEIPKSMYVCDERAPLKLLQPITVYMEPNRESQKVTLTPTNGYANQTDNKNWVQFISDNGTSVWLYIDDYDMLPDSGVSVSNIFEGLTLYD